MHVKERVESTGRAGSTAPAPGRDVPGNQPGAATDMIFSPCLFFQRAYRAQELSKGLILLWKLEMENLGRERPKWAVKSSVAQFDLIG